MEKKTLNLVFSLLVAAGFIFFQACNYYKPIQTSTSASSENKTMQIDSLRNKVFILHSSQGIYLLRDMRTNVEQQVLTATLDVVPIEHQNYVNDSKGKYRYQKDNQAVLYEVHLYAKLEPSAAVGSNVVIPVSEITRMELIERDNKRSSSSTVMAALGITVGSLALISAIYALTKSSCPFISVHDGQEYVLQGETFGGSIYHSLAREDFVPLPSAAVGPEVRIMISNELKERQYTDMANLVLVEHLKEEQIIMDPEGNLMLVKEMIEPQSAVLNNNLDMLSEIGDTDNIPCAFNDPSTRSPVNELVVKFNRPREDKKLSLFLDMRNSYWLEFLLGEFTSRFGSRYAKWVKNQNTKPGQEIIDWQEAQYMPLTISVKTSNGWQEVKKVKTIGPLMNREVAISLDEFDFEGPTIEVSFKTGFMFWEIDRINLAAVDEVPSQSVQNLKPSIAKDESGRNVLKPLLELDGHFLEQPEIGNRAYITYEIKNYSEEKAYSVFLHSMGYYEPIREYQGPADVEFLTQFREPGAFAKFSLSKYMQLTQSATFGVQ